MSNKNINKNNDNNENNDKCWFCLKYFNINEIGVIFDYEFDTYLHLECLKIELKENPENPEAQLMTYLLEQ